MESKDRSLENSKQIELCEMQENNKSKDDKMFKNKLNDNEFPTQKMNTKKIIVSIILILLLIIILIGIIVIILNLQKDESGPNKDESNPKKEELKICETGEGEKCKTCNNINKNECSTCNPGYFLPENDNNKEKCHECSLDNCKICNGTNTDNTCYECDYFLEPIVINNNKIIYCNYTCEIGEGEKCKTCGEKLNRCTSCNDGYKLKNGKCVISSFYIKGSYFTNKPNQNIKIFSAYFPISDIKEMTINDTNINIDSSKNYTFSPQGTHFFYILVNYNEDIRFSYMFREVYNIASVSFDPKLKNIEITNLACMFYYCSSLVSIDLSNLNTEKVTDMSYMFFNCKSLKSLDLSNFKTPNVKDMKDLFYNCNSLTSIDLSNFNTMNVMNMTSMFSNCKSLKSLNVKNFDTKNIINMGEMFTFCSNLTSLDLSRFETKNVVNMEKMFYGSDNLKYIDISNFEWNSSNDCKIFESFNNYDMTIIISSVFYNKLQDKKSDYNWNFNFS